MDALVDDVLAEILLRLPPKSVLRCRAVSKRWRRITTCRTFVAAYSRRQRLELLVYPDGYKLYSNAKNILAGLDPLNSDYSGCRRFLRLDGGRSLRLADSRDGLLLLAASDNGTFLICNPATRQSTVLPSLTPDPCASAVPSGLYFHEPSGEHRLLCIGRLQLKHDNHPPSSSDAAAAATVSVTGPFHYYILSTGSAAVRRLGPARGLGVAPSACVALAGVLYWSHHPESGTSVDLVAFDTVSEKFRLIPRPPLTRRHYLRVFDMEGTLAVSAVAEGSLRMDVWALEAAGDPSSSSVAAWARRLRIDLPWQRMRESEFQPIDQAVAVVEGGLLLVVGAGYLLLYDVKEKRKVSRVYYGEIGNVSRCLYRASLVPLPVPPCPGTADASSSLHYYRPDDPYPSYFGGSRDWFVPDLEYAWYLRYKDIDSLRPDIFVKDHN